MKKKRGLLENLSEMLWTWQKKSEASQESGAALSNGAS